MKFIIFNFIIIKSKVADSAQFFSVEFFGKFEVNLYLSTYSYTEFVRVVFSLKKLIWINRIQFYTCNLFDKILL